MDSTARRISCRSFGSNPFELMSSASVSWMRSQEALGTLTIAHTFVPPPWAPIPRPFWIQLRSAGGIVSFRCFFIGLIVAEVVMCYFLAGSDGVDFNRN